MLIAMLIAAAVAQAAPKPTPTPTSKPVAAPTATPKPGPLTQKALDEFAHADALMVTQWRITNAFMKGKDAQDHKRSGFAFANTLLESQRAWLHYRTAACQVEGGINAGNIRQQLIVAQCKTALTDARTLQLKGLMVVPSE